MSESFKVLPYFDHILRPSPYPNRNPACYYGCESLRKVSPDFLLQCRVFNLFGLKADKFIHEDSHPRLHIPEDVARYWMI